MARNHARIHVRIWSDPDFKRLNRDEQHAYFVIISQARVNFCGVLDYMPHRLANLTADVTIEDIENAVKLLEDARYVVTDNDTQEMLIRSFIRNDGLLNGINITKAMANDYAEVMSDKLRSCIDKELIRAYREAPEAGGWVGLKEVNPVLFNRVAGRGQK